VSQLLQPHWRAGCSGGRSAAILRGCDVGQDAIAAPKGTSYDPKDELVLEAAVNGEADALVTHHLRDFEPAARLFGLRVLLPREWLKELLT
jgi:hypothetical protein